MWDLECLLLLLFCPSLLLQAPLVQKFLLVRARLDPSLCAGRFVCIFCGNLSSLILVLLAHATKAALCHLQALPSCVAPDRLRLRLSLLCATQHALSVRF